MQLAQIDLKTTFIQENTKVSLSRLLLPHGQSAETFKSPRIANEPTEIGFRNQTHALHSGHRKIFAARVPGTGNTASRWVFWGEAATSVAGRQSAPGVRGQAQRDTAFLQGDKRSAAPQS